MGTWSNKPFGNDSARDWAWGLKDEGDTTHLEAAVHEALSEASDIDARTAEIAVAAALVIAAAASEPVRGVSKEIGAWIRASGYVPSQRLVTDAISALDKVMNSSELRELWDESERLEGWIRSTRAVRERLTSAIQGGLPKRAPRKLGMPRSLHKLLERYRDDPSDAVLSRIRRKVKKIENPNAAARDTNFKTPLSLLAEYGLIDEVRMLLDKGADPADTSTNLFGMSPFDAACFGNHIELAEMLREAGAQVFTKLEPRDVEIVCQQLDVESAQGLFKNNEYCLALFTAARKGSPEVVAYLISLGANLSQIDMNGETLLHKAAEGGNLRVLEFLIDAGLDVNQRKSRDDETPLHSAVAGGNLACVALLLNNGADPNAIEKFEGESDRWYNTPLDYAVGGTKKKPEIAAVLREHGGRKASEILNISDS